VFVLLRQDNNEIAEFLLHLVAALAFPNTDIAQINTVIGQNSALTN